MDIISTLGQSWQWITDPDNHFLRSLSTHLELSLGALFVAILVGVPWGILISRYTGVSRVVVNTAGIIRVIPSIAVLFLLIPLLHTGFRPAVVALTLLAIPPLLIKPRQVCGGDKEHYRGRAWYRHVLLAAAQSRRMPLLCLWWLPGCAAPPSR